MSFDPKSLQRPEIKDFIHSHTKSDVAALALKKPPHADWPYPAILDQIKALQKAAKKLPNWAKNPDIILPAPDLIEQASSQACANFKASLFKGKSFADLTAGAGIDTLAFAKNFNEGVCVDKSEITTEILQHNFETLSIKHVAIHHQDAAKALQIMDKKDLIFIDPQRRDKNAKGFIKLENYAPNVLELLPALKNACDTLLIKASPMLDLWQAAKDLSVVDRVFVIEWQGECKELLFQCDMNKKTQLQDIAITCVSINDEGQPLHQFTFTKAEEDSATPELATPEPGDLIFEPGPTLMKGGAFKTLAARYDLKKLHPHTHLYIVPNAENISGRWFTLENILPVERKALPVKKANLAIRNFPDSV
ncbi:MAG: RsmD family RNA methyltransferase, partial [Pseudomonadota bacterium]